MLKNCCFLLECTRDGFVELHCTSVEIEPPPMYFLRRSTLSQGGTDSVQLQRKVDTRRVNQNAKKLILIRVA